MPTDYINNQEDERSKELERIKKWIEERRATLNKHQIDERTTKDNEGDNSVISINSVEDKKVISETNTLKKDEHQRENTNNNIDLPEKISTILLNKNYPSDKKDWLINLPWRVIEPSIPDLDIVEKVLDESHFGMEKVKQRMLEHIAVQSHLKCVQGTVLLLLGPPGVGKTSIAKTLAKALNRVYTKINLGAIGSSFELIGASSSWKNAQPGLIVKALRQTQSLSPLILLDEIDKIGNDKTHGEATSALLEILDSDRKAFKDNYLEIEIDLSNVFYVATANNINDIDPILRDRLEVIELSGYTTENKLSIARDYIIPRKLKAYNLDTSKFNISDDALRYIVMQYCHELGVRKLESHISAICRKMVYLLITGKCSEMIVERRMLLGLLGKPVISASTVLDKPEVGVVNAVGVMDNGQGIIFPVEVSSINGDGDVFYTGGFSEGCEEVFEVVMTIMKMMGGQWGVKVSNFDNYDLHVHAYFPSIKKEGSSIGLAFFIAFLSSLINVPIRNDIAVTGELTLHGRIMPIGGLEPKIIAAVQAGLKKIVIPSGNKTHIEEVESSLLSNLDIVFIDSLDALINEVLIDL
jgi:ATP-dependent Lon protease